MNDAKQCPDCDSPIDARAASCKCGWKADLAKAMHDTETAVRLEEQKESEARAARSRMERFLAAGSPNHADCLKRIDQVRSASAMNVEERWRRILADPNAVLIAKEMARAALAKLCPVVEREPGSDDEPVAHA